MLTNQTGRAGAARGLAAAALIGLAAFAPPSDQGVGGAPTRALAPDGRYISWREHVVDDGAELDGALTGGDGLILADLDGDGREDIVSVHESDTRYDGRPDGFVRIAFATGDPRRWVNVTLARGREAAAPEDAAVGDVNGDGLPDIVVASELAHVAYFQNPGREARRGAAWRRLIIPQTEGHGSYIRVFLADLDGDGRPEVTTANKGAQNPSPAETRTTPVSVLRPRGDPLIGANWVEQVLGRYPVPQNAQPVDLDGDGDKDIVAGVRVGARLVVFENAGGAFREIPVRIDGAQTGGFHLGYADVDRDGRLDMVGVTNKGLAWIRQPERLDGVWTAHVIGDTGPDRATGVLVADLDGDGDDDVLTGGYSAPPRDRDGDLPLDAAMGRLAWFQNPGAAKAGAGPWPRHDISRRRRGMFDMFVARDLDGDGDQDILFTRGNSEPYDGVFWLEQVRTAQPAPALTPARPRESREMPLP
ncbi:MAG: VCBS repeat-containing protein [Phenylobacterium sp.]|uniref:FG-GAP repeat domain-containing protein n=1 Tax=Phenylobacterium sp. TaxID=1871053 RepID=UPI001A5920AE|nr:VCBS repeat-containing protein [Phenylobacterium sp.]MBL8770243.1 VCBS repeat-containing protein [Phenylobacterium sp.]